MKKVPSTFYTFSVLIKNSVKRYQVCFYCFSDSLKLDYEKITQMESSLSSFRAAKIEKDGRANLSSSRS